MSNSVIRRLMRAETLTAICIFLVAAGFMVPTLALKPLSALLPAAMLISLLVLSLFLLVLDQRKAAAGEVAKPVARSPKRVLTAFALTIAYVLAVDFLGFYGSTAISVPLFAYVFGYRKPQGLVIATLVVLVAIYLVFGFAMSQEFPSGRLWSM